MTQQTPKDQQLFTVPILTDKQVAHFQYDRHTSPATYIIWALAALAPLGCIGLVVWAVLSGRL